MISIMVFMSAVQQVLIGVVSSVIVAAAVGYGTGSYFAGEVKAEISYIKGLNPAQMKADIQLNTQRNDDQDKRIDNFESLVTKGMEDQRDQWALVFGELKSISISSARQEEKIGAIEVDVAEIKEKIK